MPGLVGTSAAIGQRHYQVVIQMFTDTTSDSGFPVEDFVDLATVYAAREPILIQSNAERLNADQITARSFARWTMPFLDAIDPDKLPVAKMRLVYEGRAHDIIEAHTVGVRAEIVVTTMVKTA